MFNVTIVRKKDLIRYLFFITIAVLAIVFLFNMTMQKNEQYKEEKNNNSFIDLIKKSDILGKTLPQVFNNNKEQKNSSKISENTYIEKILKREISTIRSLEKSRNKSNEENSNIKEQTDNSNEQHELDNSTTQNSSTNENIQTNESLNTEIVTQNPIAENYNIEYGTVKIKNQTDYTLTQENLTPNITIDNKNIIIYHTHTCESYTPSDNYNYQQNGNFRTTDLNFSIVRVGNELENNLKSLNYNVIHDSSYHDYPTYNGSYTRSLNTISNILKSNPSDIVIDLHRDAVGARPDYAPKVKIGNDYAAQIMYVIRHK